MLASNAPTAGRVWQAAVIALLVLILVGVWRGSAPLTPPALAQNQPLAGARGVFAFTGQLDRDSYGLFMLDADQNTLWCYALDPHESGHKLRLVAARSFLFDRYLTSLNVDGLTPQQVRDLVNHERRQRLDLNTEQPSSDPLDFATDTP